MRTSLLHRRHHPGGRIQQDHRLHDALRRSERVPQPRADVTPEPVAEVSPDAERVREAVRGSTRRTVVRTAVWSVPVIAAATAAPAFAASLPVCGICGGSGRPAACDITVVIGQPAQNPPATCSCGTGLACATVGPLNLAAVCVATGLVATTCGSTTCTGVCLAAGGTVVNAVNLTLPAALSTALAALNLLPGCTAGSSGFIPGNICTVPVSDVNAGPFGALCITNTGTGAIAGTANTAVAALKVTLAGAGLAGVVFANQCATGYSCRAGVSATAGPPGALFPLPPTNCLGQSLALTVGFCQC